MCYLSYSCCASMQFWIFLFKIFASAHTRSYFYWRFSYHLPNSLFRRTETMKEVVSWSLLEIRWLQKDSSETICVESVSSKKKWYHSRRPVNLHKKILFYYSSNIFSQLVNIFLNILIAEDLNTKSFLDHKVKDDHRFSELKIHSI